MDTRFTEGAPLPPAIGLCADLYAEVRELRLAMQKHVDNVKAREREVREHIIANLSKSLDSGAAGLKYRAQIVSKERPSLKDWDAFTGYVAVNRRFDLLQKRLSDKAVMDLFNDDVSVPGVELFNAIDVSITKI